MNAMLILFKIIFAFNNIFEEDFNLVEAQLEASLLIWGRTVTSLY